MRGENRINFDQRCGLLEGENDFWTSIIPNIYFVEDLNLFKKIRRSWNNKGIQFFFNTILVEENMRAKIIKSFV